MKPTQDKYPVFEANQVLTNAHLNQQFNYLDEQERLTRANLIGTGIVCGLDIRLDNVTTPATIYLSKGCGISSEGYLIIEPDDLELVSYRKYDLPNDISYPAFNHDDNGTSTQYPLWELFTNGEPNTSPLESLDDKAVLLFLELKKEGMRNCSPNNCDDKGADVTTTVRRLLISKNDLKAIIAKANGLSADLAFTDLETKLSAQLNLPDLRLPRYDVPNSQPVTSNEVLAAFLKVFSAGNLVASIGDALIRAYQAFQPILKATYGSNPFTEFTKQFGFLAGTPATAEQVRFLPYYYDFFDDLIRAYDEFRWQGLDLLCACCPSGSLFPRHLMLGLLFPDAEPEAAIYRHRFLASAAISNCEQRTREVVLLFQRLVEIINQFTHTPSLPTLTKAFIDPQIRITPSKLGDVTLSDKAIPYYYQQTGTPPLYQLWSAEKNRRNKANQNLSYRADKYAPAAPVFITQPLAYDLESYNFLRIEGHLGKNYQSVLNTLLSLKSNYRLPIDIIALRTGAFDEKAPVDLGKESCRFQDLEILYNVTREQMLCFLVKELTYFYNLPLELNSPVTTAVKSQFAVINRYAPDFLVQINTLGRGFEDYITQQGGIVPEIDANLLASWINIFSPGDILVYYSFFYLIKLANTLPDDFASVNFTDLEIRFKNLQIVVNAIEKKREQGTSNLEGTAAILNWEEIDDRLEDLLNACQLDALKAIRDEYARRLKEVKKKQFLGNFLPEHPGIQHKAGVPLGGTFIILYHQEPAVTASAPTVGVSAVKAGVDPLTAGMILPVHVTTANLTNFKFTPIEVTHLQARVAAQEAVSAEKFAVKTGRAEFLNANPAAAQININTVNVGTASNKTFTDAIKRLQAQQTSSTNSDLQLVLDGLSVLMPVFPAGSFEFLSDAEKIIAATVNDFTDGTVIGDFYLPYQLCSDCVAVQFVLPKIPPTFNVKIACPNSDGIAQVTVLPKGGLPPYDVKIDELDYQSLGETLGLEAGSHTVRIRDAESTESASQTITVATPITFGEPSYQCNEDFSSYTATFLINGGTPPLTVNGAAITGNTYTTNPIPSGAGASIEVVDSNQCAAKTEVTHACVKPCDLPCSGIARRRGYRFILPDATSNFQLSFSFEFPRGSTIDLSEAVQKILQEAAGDSDSFAKQINSLIADKTGSSDWLKFDHDPSQPGSLDTWWIEYFECLQFKFGFSWPLGIFTHVVPITTIIITPAASHIVINEGERVLSDVTIPAFDGTKIDKCNLQIPVESQCPKELDLALKISKKVSELTVSLNVKPSGSDVPVAYLWEVQDGNPAISNNQQVSITFTQREPKIKRIRLTAFTEKGCRVVQEDQITLG